MWSGVLYMCVCCECILCGCMGVCPDSQGQVQSLLPGGVVQRKGRGFPCPGISALPLIHWRLWVLLNLSKSVFSSGKQGFLPFGVVKRMRHCGKVV